MTTHTANNAHGMIPFGYPQYTPGPNTAYLMKRYGYPDFQSMRPTILPILADAISLLETLEWTQGNEATDHSGKPMVIAYCDKEELDDICFVCLTGAVHLAIRQNDEEFPTFEDEHNAFDLTRSYLTDIIRAEPEAQRPPSDPIYPSPHYLEPENWNDKLNKLEGKSRTMTLLKRAFDTLPERKTE